MKNPYRHVHLEGDQAGSYMGLAENFLRGLRRLGDRAGLVSLAKMVQVNADVVIKVYYCDAHDFIRIKVGGGDGYFILGDESTGNVVYGTDRLSHQFHSRGAVGGSSPLAVSSLLSVGRHAALAQTWGGDYEHVVLYRTTDAARSFTSLGTFTCQYPGSYSGHVNLLLPLGLITQQVNGQNVQDSGLYYAACQLNADGHYYPFGLLSLDGGGTWTPIDLPQTVGIDHAPPILKNLDTRTLAGFQAFLSGSSLPVGLVSADRGQTWTVADLTALWQDLPTPSGSLQAAANAFVASAALIYSGSGHVVALGPWNNTLQVLRSADWGQTWTVGPILVQGSDWPGAAITYCKALAPGVLLYVAPTATPSVVKAWLTGDHGATWVLKSTLTFGSTGGRAGVFSVQAPMQLSALDGSVTQQAELYLPVWDGSNYRLLHSTDSAGSWSNAAVVPTPDTAPDPSRLVLTRFNQVARLGTKARPALIDYVFPHNYNDQYTPV